MKKILLLALIAAILPSLANAGFVTYNASNLDNQYLNVSGYNYSGGIYNDLNKSDDTYFVVNDTTYTASMLGAAVGGPITYATRSPFVTVCGQDSGATTVPYCRIFNATDTSVSNRTGNAPATAGAGEWYRMRANTKTNELLLCVSDSNDDLDCQIFNGSAFTSSPQEMTPNDTTNDVRSFDMAFEQKSGRALVVYSVNVANTLGYKIWNGGSWSNEQWMTITGGGNNGGTLTWVRLAADPNSNNITLAVQNATVDGSVFTARWNGTDSSWSASTMLTPNTGSDASAITAQSMDVAYNNESAALLFYSKAASAGNVFARVAWPNGTIDNEVQVGDDVSGAGAIYWIKAASMPRSSRIGFIFIDEGGSTEELNFNEWEYKSAFTTVEIDTAIEGGVSTSGKNADLIPIREIEGWAVPYGDNNADIPTIAHCLSKSGCQAGTWGTNAIFTDTSPNDAEQTQADDSWYNSSQGVIGWTVQDTGSPFNIHWGIFYCHTSACALVLDTDMIIGASITLPGVFEVTSDQYSNYTMETWFNSTSTTSLGEVSESEVNGSFELKATFAGNYSAYIYSWVDAAWHFCASQVATPGSEFTLTCQVCASGCTITDTASEYRSTTGNDVRAVRMALNETVHNLANNETTVSVDHINYNVTYSIPASLKIAQFRLWRSSSTTIGMGAVDPVVYDHLACNITSSFGNNIPTGAASNACNNTSPYGAAYRGEIRLCNDAASGADPVAFTNTNHISVSTQYLGALTTDDCGSGDNGSTWTGTTCATYTGSDGLQVVEITGNTVMLAGDGSTRKDTNCDYYAYRFTTGNPDWIVTDTTTFNTTGASSGSNPTSGSNLVNVTYSETAFALYYPSSGCTVGNGSEGRVRPRYYNETCTAAHGCDPQNATFENWNDTLVNSIVAIGTEKLFYNFTGVQTDAGTIYWTLETAGPGSGEIHAWDYDTSKWVQLGTKASVGATFSMFTPVNTTYGNIVSADGYLNLTFNITSGSILRFYDVYYDGNHTDKCAKCFFTTVNPNAKNVACEGQTGGGLSGTSFFDLQNLGSVIEDWKVFIDSAMPTGIDFFINDSSSTHVTLSTTPQTFNSSIEFFEHAYAWAWANFTNVGASSNERQFTSNTSWK